jgi:spore germination cell wall hydrolase CwlJ-like protein
MIRTVRAAAFAVAAFAFAAAAFSGGPVRAQAGEVAAPVASYLDHGSASVAAFSGALGVNDEAPPPAANVPRSLDALVAEHAAVETSGAEQDCLANAVYFEARSEPLQGQLAVAEVVINRAASGQYPATLCGVVVQPAQFSFVRRGRIPRADRGSDAWRRAVAVARIAKERMTPRVLPASCLWYHARYVSPRWGRRLAQSARIGLHIFYS